MFGGGGGGGFSAPKRGIAGTGVGGGKWDATRAGLALGTLGQSEVVRDSSNLRREGAKIIGQDTTKQKKIQAEQQRQLAIGNEAASGVLDRMKQQEVPYLRKLEDLEKETKLSETDARAVYSDTSSRFKNIMEDANREANTAMTLQEAGDPNNRVHQAVRQMYETQAQNIGRQGLADSGVLAGMGAQATAQQFGMGGPMSGAQMQLMSAANQRQAGEAYSRAQARMDDMRQQGIDRGFDESGRQYERGERARDRYRGSVADYGANQDNITNEMRKFRGERGMYAGQQAGVLAGQGARDLAQINQHSAGTQAALNAQMQMDLANRQGNQQLFGTLLGAGAKVGAAYAGGGAA